MRTISRLAVVTVIAGAVGWTTVGWSQTPTLPTQAARPQRTEAEARARRAAAVRT